MWKLYLFSVLLAARVCVHTCDPNSSPQLRSVCPPKPPLVDLFEFVPNDCLTGVKELVNSAASSYPREFKWFMLLGVLQLLAENLLGVYVVYYVISSLVTGVVKVTCWVLLLSGLIAVVACFLGLQSELVVSLRMVLGATQRLLAQVTVPT